MKQVIAMCLVALLVPLWACPAQAVVSLGGTRLVFDGRFREAILDVSNPGQAQVLIQAWIAKPGAAPSAQADLPFVLTPHLAQIPAMGRHRLRVLYEGVGMPLDRESLLHLYVLEVPRRSEARQQLNIAVRQRINVFYRPKGLAGDPADVPLRLRWQRGTPDSHTLSVRNPTPFHASLLNIAFNGVEVSEDLMIEPFSERLLPLPKTLPEGLSRLAGEGCLSFKALTDYGGQRDFSTQGHDSEPFTARLRDASGRTLASPQFIEKC